MCASGVSVVSAVQQEVFVPFVSRVVVPKAFVVHRDLDFPNVGGQSKLVSLTPLCLVSCVFRKFLKFFTIVPRCDFSNIVVPLRS